MAKYKRDGNVYHIIRPIRGRKADAIYIDEMAHMPDMPRPVREKPRHMPSHAKPFCFIWMARAAKDWTCLACTKTIAKGQHYMKVDVFSGRSFPRIGQFCNDKCFAAKFSAAFRRFYPAMRCDPSDVPFFEYKPERGVKNQFRPFAHTLEFMTMAGWDLLPAYKRKKRETPTPPSSPTGGVRPEGVRGDSGDPQAP